MKTSLFPHLSDTVADLFNDLNRLGSLRGFDLLDGLDRDLSLLSFNDTYPPSNIVKIDDQTWAIELALAGFKRDQITVEHQGRKLTIKGSTKSKTEEDGPVYVKRGIGARDFTLSFTLPDHADVDEATFQDGILAVQIKRELPPEAKPKLIELK